MAKIKYQQGHKAGDPRLQTTWFDIDSTGWKDLLKG